MGQPDAQLLLGQLYIIGKYVPKDEQKGFKFIEAAKNFDESEFVLAYEDLGILYFCGMGVEKNLLTAKKLWEDALAFDNYHLTSAVYLAHMYLDGGSNLPANPTLALKILDRLVKYSKVVPAMLELAKIYFDGKYARQDLKKAYELFKSAAAKKNYLAYSYLSLMNSKGLGVRKNAKRAEDYLRKAQSLAQKFSYPMLFEILIMQPPAEIDDMLNKK